MVADNAILARLSQHSTAVSSHAAEGAPPSPALTLAVTRTLLLTLTLTLTLTRSLAPTLTLPLTLTRSTVAIGAAGPLPGGPRGVRGDGGRGCRLRRVLPSRIRRDRRGPRRLAIEVTPNSQPPTQMPQALSPKPRTPNRDPSPPPPRTPHPNSAELRDALERLSVHTSTAGERGSAADTERLVSAAEAALAWS